MALYAELDEKADHLRRADEMKSRFLSNMSHEFRTPLNSILALSRLLLDRLDGELTAEQEKQVAFIRKAAEDLSELVNDLLDLAKVEAGKIDGAAGRVRRRATCSARCAACCGRCWSTDRVELVFEEPSGLPTLVHRREQGLADPAQLHLQRAQVHRARRGARRARPTADDGDSVVFAVPDTGIGIAPEDQERIFEEFAQVDNSLQRRVRGTGLGPAAVAASSRSCWAARVGSRAQLGVGSTFYVSVARMYHPAEAVPAPEPSGPSRLGARSGPGAGPDRRGRPRR